MDLLRILNNDLSGMKEEEIEFAQEFNNKLRESIIDELVIFEGKELINIYNSNKEDYYEKIDLLFVNGIKGYKVMTLKQLIDIYLSKKGENDFISLIGKINN